MPKGLWPLVLLPLLALSSCIRVNAGAGYWKQNSGETAPELHTASFDTADLLPKSRIAK